MKRLNRSLCSLCLALGMISTTGAQIQTTELPEPGFEKRIKAYVNEDLVSASNMKGIMNIVFSNDFPLEDLWELFNPFFQKMRNTGYARAVLLAANDIYGIRELNEDCIRFCQKKSVRTAKL